MDTRYSLPEEQAACRWREGKGVSTEEVGIYLYLAILQPNPLRQGMEGLCSSVSYRQSTFPSGAWMGWWPTSVTLSLRMNEVGETKGINYIFTITLWWLKCYKLNSFYPCLCLGFIQLKEQPFIAEGNHDEHAHIVVEVQASRKLEKKQSTNNKNPCIKGQKQGKPWLRLSWQKR